MYRLMIKTCKTTGLKYLCQTSKEDYLDYRGSGKFWKWHITKHNSELETEVLGEYETHDELKKRGREFSEKFNIVESQDWANLRIEEGDGGDTVSNKKWITNGLEEKYVDKVTNIPDGWRCGRSDRCTFKNVVNQRNFCSRVDVKKRGDSIKKAWDEGRFIRDNSRCGVHGDMNSSKRPEVREKISKSHIGKKHTIETKKKMSLSKLGHAGANKGKKLSEEVKNKIREGNLRWRRNQNILHDKTNRNGDKKE